MHAIFGAGYADFFGPINNQEATMAAKTGRLLIRAVQAAIVLLMLGRVAAAEETILRVYPVGDGTLTAWTLADLRGLPVIEFETTTPFTDGPQRFAGAALSGVLGDVPADAVLILKALNDYSVRIPVAEISPQTPIIAYERNGEVMSVRKKGPLWIVYPFDADPEFQNETIYGRSIWQLVEIQVDTGP
jgi:hypothetical protein